MTVDLSYDIRPYRREDLPAVRALLDETLVVSPAGGPPSALFSWKHLRNPFGLSFMLVAEAEGRVVGLRAFMRWQFRAADRIVRAVRAVDTATAPAHQGRGVFARLTRRALEELEGGVDLVFNTPNEQSGPGYLKMGWREVGRVPVHLRIRRPLRFVRGMAGARGSGEGSPEPHPRLPDAGDVLRDDRVVEGLVPFGGVPSRLATPRTPGYLRWRYASVPGLRYGALLVERDGGSRGLAIIRGRRRGRLSECTVEELLVRPSDHGAARDLLRRIAGGTRTDHLLAILPPGSPAARAGRRSGFARWGRGPVLMVNQLTEGVLPDPSDMASWALSAGDLELF